MYKQWFYGDDARIEARDSKLETRASNIHTRVSIQASTTTSVSFYQSLFSEMNRKDLEKNSVCLVEGRFGKPDLIRVEIDGQAFMVKDVRRRNIFLRWTLGLWLIQQEWKIYSRLKGVKGIPKPLERIDRFAFAMEFIEGVPIERGGTIPPSFFLALDQVLKGIHSRGVVHMDLRHKGNILVSEKGEPFLIDFNSGFFFKEGGLLHRLFFRLFRWVDYGGLLKLKERVSLSSMTPEETDFLKRFNRLRKLWIFN